MTYGRVGLRVAIAAVCAALALSGCGAAGSGKAGGPDEPVQLVLTNNDGGGGLSTAPAIGYFVDRVREVSGGRLVIRVEPGEFVTDGAEVRAVAAGRADLGWVGTRVFDLLGVDELRPLHAPLLVDDYPLQAALVRSDVAQKMLAAIRRLDVEPLGLLADEMRFPAAVKPLLTPADWQGARLWLLDSDAYTQAVEALGATVVNGGDPREMLLDGSAQGIEAMWIYYTLGSNYLQAPYVMPNVVLSPRTMALFANPRSVAALGADEQAWLRQASEDTTVWSADHAADRDAGYIAQSCRYGTRVVTASTDQLAALRQVVEPLYARMRADPATAEGLTGIEALKARTPAGPAPTVPDGCRYQPGEPSGLANPAPLAGPGPSGELPTGTYRYTLTADQVVGGGDEDSILHRSRAGVFTWTLGAGTWSVTATPTTPGIAPVRCEGWYAVDGQTATFTYPDLDPDVAHCMPPTWAVRWAAGDGDMQWGPPSVPILASHFALQHWERIG